MPFVEEVSLMGACARGQCARELYDLVRKREVAQKEHGKQAQPGFSLRSVRENGPDHLYQHFSGYAGVPGFANAGNWGADPEERSRSPVAIVEREMLHAGSLPFEAMCDQRGSIMVRMPPL